MSSIVPELAAYKKRTPENHLCEQCGQVNKTHFALCRKCRKRLIASASTRKLMEHLRLAIIELFGGKCMRCGFADVRALQLDHMLGGGQKHYRKIGPRYVYEEVLRMSKEERKQKYQLLCSNCNWIKRSERRENRKAQR